MLITKKILDKNKKAFAISFAWLFSLIVGAVILFLAVYFAIKIMNIGETEISAKTAEQLRILLEPLETKLEEGWKQPPVEMPSETKIYNRCEKTGLFGVNKISLSYKSMGNKWTRESVAISQKNKYIFSDRAQGRKIYIFIKPFKLPFKVSDLIFVYTERYCFVGSIPQAIRQDLNLGLGDSMNIVRADNIRECEEGDIKVCFNRVGKGCDIEVNCIDDCSEGSVRKNNRNVEFIGSLIYGAIFSDFQEYECNVDRLMTRLGQLSEIYKRKAFSIAIMGCSTNLESDIDRLADSANSYRDSKDLYSIKSQADSIEQKNRRLTCRLF